MERDPCPKRIWYDCGAAFAVGFIGGSLWHGIKGSRNSPQGMKMRGAFMSIKTKGPVLGGNFAVWGGLFSSFDCLLAHVRGTEDPLNPIMSGAITGGVLAARGGLMASAKSAAVGGILLAMIEGLNFMIMRMMPAPEDPHKPRPQAPPAPPAGYRPSASAGPAPPTPPSAPPSYPSPSGPAAGRSRWDTEGMSSESDAKSRAGFAFKS